MMTKMYPLPDEFQSDFKTEWQSFLAAADSAEVRFADVSDLLSSAERVFPFSNFVASACIRSPGLLADLIESGHLCQSYREDSYALRLKDLLADTEEQKTLERRLRRFRLREMIRIAWRDLSGWADLFETVADLSNLAEACIESALDFLYRWQCETHGIPFDNQHHQQHLVVIGMGKLGGRELNFSSDVDLIFAYPFNGMTVGADKEISNEAFFIRLSRSLLQVLGKATEDGIVFRVDLRLRPFGENGPVTMDFDAMERYYQDQGREWERYAWIKARTVAGDKVAGARLLDKLNPFVYRRYLDYGAFNSLREMKQSIALEIKRKGMQGNIKLGRGGIREIEFFGQIFQLIRGGVTPPLQERSILNVLAYLSADGYIPEAVHDELKNAYIFMRNLEHRLQEFSDQQTHQLPSSPKERLRLALSMGFENETDLYRELQRHRGNVHRHFSMLLETKSTSETDKVRDTALDRIWQEVADSRRAEEILADIGFNDTAGAVRALSQLRNDFALRTLSPEGQRRLDKLIPMLLTATGKCSEPLTTMIRITDLIRAIEGRTSYLALLLENPDSLDHLVKLSSASSLIAAFLARHPVLLDELLDPRTLYSPPKREELEKELHRRIQRLAGDFEYQLEELRVFKQVNVLRVAAADVTEVLALMRVSDHLTDIAEVLLDEVLDLAWEHLVEKYGRPSCLLADGGSCGRGFTVIAYGKLGGLELGYGSDLDLVFLHSGTSGMTEGGGRSIDSNQFFARLGQRVIHLLTTPTSAGVLYEADMRLRPSGSSGTLVSHIESYRNYQLNDAWTWEHQALIRARAVGGDPALKQRFEEIRKEILSKQRDRRKLTEEVKEMRLKMRKQLLKSEPGHYDLKQGTGGIVDIEFLVQYLVLLHSCSHERLLVWTDNVRLIQSLIETGVIDELDAHILKHAYLIYRALAHKLSLQEKPAKISDQRFKILRQKVEAIWNAHFS
jgi:glutamate-ammonia-ligase adenylyltransferase